MSPLEQWRHDFAKFPGRALAISWHQSPEAFRTSGIDPDVDMPLNVRIEGSCPERRYAGWRRGDLWVFMVDGLGPDEMHEVGAP